MSKEGPTLVSRAQLARYAGVSRAAVTNWRKRGPDFPEPADAERELFDLDQVADWLSSRAVPVNARQPHEPTGTTYADRVRASIRAQGTGEPLPSSAPDAGGEGFDKTVREVERLLWHALDGLRGYFPPSESCYLLLDLLYMHAEHTDAWRELLLHIESPSGPTDLPDDVTALLRPRLSLSLDALGKKDPYRALRNIALIGSGDDRTEKLVIAFDLLLSILEEDRSTGILRTPDSLVEAVVGLLVTDTAPSAHVHDPFCRTGEFLIAADKRLRNGSSATSHRLSGAGGHTDQTRTAGMNLRIHGVEADLLTEAVEPGLLPDLSPADLVITNPPFNARLPTVFGPPGSPPLDWPTPVRRDERCFPYGLPPESNANFAWLQHVVTMLAPNGRAGVLMPTNAAFSDHPDERRIRSAMVEDGAVEAVVAFPSQLFPTTGIPVSLWLLRSPAGRCSEMLFIDAGDLGSMASRTRRVLLPPDIDAVHAVYRSWKRGEALGNGLPAPGRAVGIDEIRNRDHSLHPPSYVTAGHDPEGAGAQAAERFNQLTRRLSALEGQVPETDSRVRHLLKEVHRWIP
ncbi:N-6 DNA methylase [Nocardiopsis alborubida]|uniref:N-6 DNA methylase n=1 Tax=Nocardiopsis alborubida TaxID=146802 RepID=A0A7X6MIE4_9ACTN|nr:N-6 DNA methylase [Nocardiopsis alborubida]NKZ01090.1 N-6 DNA methylase [Nocardiopsis alborubida]